MKYLLLIALLFIVWHANAQVSINNDNSAPDPSAMLEIKSTNKGLLPPRMSQEELSLIANPANGLIVFCTTDNKLYMYLTSLGLWKEIQMGAGFIQPQVGCGSAIVINHVAGNVAPVSKATSYGTITGIAGEPLKCLLTSNLGSDHQATAMNDSTEASAGWYWQFNRKQGYKHNGTTRTPATVWTGYYNENSAWTLANDPCRIELGGMWRILTITEWSNIYTAGGWTNWTGPWNSPLKLHVGGAINLSGNLQDRGVHSAFWSSNQEGNSYGWYFSHSSNSCGLYNTASKAFGFNLRCISDL